MSMALTSRVNKFTADAMIIRKVQWKSLLHFLANKKCLVIWGGGGGGCPDVVFLRNFKMC